MRDFPSCSGENGVQIADSSSSNAGKSAQSLVICIYRCRIRGRTCLITVTWTKNLMGQCVTVGVDDSCNRSLCKVEIKPWLFTKRKGSKNLEAYSCNIDVFWDLSSAKFGSSPEPLGGFYLGVVVDKEMALLLGDMKKEAFKKTNASPSSSLGAVFIAKKEHVFGKRTFATKAQFSGDGKTHDLVIECDTSLTDPCLILRVDGKTLMQVKRLHWKFRGNDTIIVNRISVEVLWDVHGWFFGMPSSAGNAVFMFRTCQSVEKTWSFTQVPTSSKSQSFGFSLILYVHSYQSYLWNNAASLRVKKYGTSQVVLGDLVSTTVDAAKRMVNSLTSEHKESNEEALDCDQLDDTAVVDLPAERSDLVKVVGIEDLESGTYSASDIVLPLPGSRVIYPSHDIAEIYHDLAKKDGISLTESIHGVKEFSITSMTGGYRRLFQTPIDFEWELLTYTDSNKPLAETDLDRITMENQVDKAGSAEENEDESMKSDTNPPESCETNLKDESKEDEKDSGIPDSEQAQIALKMALTLPSSCYATMAIRELLKTSTSVAYHKTLN